MNGLQYAGSYGVRERYQFDLLKAPFEDEFDTVCMFDVLEHIEDDQLALKNVQCMLNKDGMIVLTVPAHMWLWNRDDVVAGHKRRYTKAMLNAKLEEAGFEIMVSRYFFIFIIPLLWLRTIVQRDSKESVRQEEYQQELAIHPLINKVLLGLSRFENWINHLIPNIMGGSIFVIARKK